MDKKYIKCSDEQIIELIREGDDNALDYLLNKYKPLVTGKARSFYLIDGDKDDLVQEGMIGLYKAIMDYDDHKECSFSYFAGICIGRQLINAIKASNRKKNIPLNTYISLYASASDYEENELPLEEMLAPPNSNPEASLIDRERVNTMKYSLIRKLSKFETDVYNMYIDGISYGKIAVILDKNPKSIDNAIQRIKSKLRQVIKELDSKE